MPISPRVRGSVAVALLAAAAIPALGQDRPQSILPPGFGEPAPAATPSARPTGPAPAPLATGGALVQPLPTDAPSETPSATPTMSADMLAEYEMPSVARRSLAQIGPAGPGDGGLRPDAFGRADGRYIEMLMRRLSAPLPSRWMSILLRRALVSSLATPAHVDGADFAAERAWLLLRMGESVSARAVVQAVDTDRYTAKLYQVAMNAMLATGDPAGMCPLQPGAAAAAPERSWTLAAAMCAALAGDAKTAGPLLAQARRRRVASGIDLQLAQKVVGAGPGGGQAVTIEWAGVDRLTAWRYGLAAATGVPIPAGMMASVGPQVTYWRALSPDVPPADRVAAAEAAAAQGVLSNAALVDLYGAIDADGNAPDAASAAADDLRGAYVGAGDARLAALRQLWGDAGKPTPYARLVLTAHAAARVPVTTGAAEADRLVASMLTAGLDRTAARWLRVASAGGDAWAMLVLADPDSHAQLSYRDVSGYAGTGNAASKRRLFFAGLAGLGRLASDDLERTAQALDVRIGTQNGWTRALDRAVAGDEPGTVVLLCATGMQTPDWRGVPPEMLYRMLAALRAVGLDGEARMIAAEAIARA